MYRKMEQFWRHTKDWRKKNEKYVKDWKIIKVQAGEKRMVLTVEKNSLRKM